MHASPTHADRALLDGRVAELVALFATIAHTRMAGVPVMNPVLDVEAVGFECLPAGADAADGRGSCEEGPVDAGGVDTAAAAGAGTGTGTGTGTGAETAVVGLGVLITPWFMNLVCLPLRRADATLGVGVTRVRQLGGRPFGFIGAHEPAVGAFSACSLFSPMFDFADQAAARATARAVMWRLRPGPGDGAAAPSATSATSATFAAVAAVAAVAAAAPAASPDATLDPQHDTSIAARTEPRPARRAFLFGRAAAVGSRT